MPGHAPDYARLGKARASEGHQGRSAGEGTFGLGLEMEKNESELLAKGVTAQRSPRV